MWRIGTANVAGSLRFGVEGRRLRGEPRAPEVVWRWGVWYSREGDPTSLPTGPRRLSGRLLGRPIGVRGESLSFPAVCWVEIEAGKTKSGGGGDDRGDVTALWPAE